MEFCIVRNQIDSLFQNTDGRRLLLCRDKQPRQEFEICRLRASTISRRLQVSNRGSCAFPAFLLESQISQCFQHGDILRLRRFQLLRQSPLTRAILGMRQHHLAICLQQRQWRWSRRARAGAQVDQVR